MTGQTQERGSGLGIKIVALIGILVLAYILLKLVIGLFSVLVWVGLAVLCAIGIVWLASKL